MKFIFFMYLKSIELNGFKSFAKKSELTFNTKVSAIVGPNGSGKSNVAEAFRFVLGEQSIKSLRGKKGEDLIFNGAGDLPRSNRASVKVVFDNTTKFLPVDFETVTIERVVHRDSVNEYLINGSQVRLKDVVELLASAHIGSSGHHIISQGEADRILNSSPKERKNMIEDALGLKMYQYKKVESQKKLLKTKENIEKVESLRREILPHIKFLKKQVEKVEKAIQMKEELQKEALEYCKREDEYIKTTEAKLHHEKTPLSHKEKELEHELAKAKSILENAKNKDGLSDRLITLENDLHKARDEKDELFRNFGRLDGEINSLVKMVRKQEEVARSMEHKTVTLVSVEELSVKIEEKIKTAKVTNDAGVLLRALDEVFGLVTDFINGHNTEEDIYIANSWKSFAESVYQEPWYEYNYWRDIKGIWSETTFFKKTFIRSTERKLAFTISYSIKAVYAKILKMAARSAFEVPENKTISIVLGLDKDKLPLGVSVLGVLNDNLSVIETGRYQEFTTAAIELAGRGVEFVKIMDHDKIMLSYVSNRQSESFEYFEGAEIISKEKLSGSSSKRVVLNVELRKLTRVINILISEGIVPEHIYDY